MNEDDLRVKIYETLGLEIGSLSSESGNDWMRAEKEVLAEYKQEQMEKLSNIKQINYLTLDKNCDSFIFILISNLPQHEGIKSIFATRNDINDNDIDELILKGSKETIMNLIRFHKLSEKHIDMIIPKSVYLSKKYLIEMQTLNDSQKESLRAYMNNNSSAYKELLLLLNA